MSLFIKRKRIPAAVLSVSLAWCIVATASVWLYPSFFDTLNWRIYDGKMALLSRPEPSEDIVHVDVDDAAITAHQYGQWPWSRALSGRIVQRLSELGAKTIVLDVLYTAPGRVPEEDEVFFESLSRATNAVTATGLGITRPPDGAPHLVAESGRMDALYDKCWTVPEPVVTSLLRVWRLDNSFVPLKPVIQGSREVGHIKSTPDRDGVHRRVPLLVKLENRFVPSLTMAALAACGKVRSKDLILDIGNVVRIRNAHQEINIPVDSRGMMLINWTKSLNSFKHYSVMDVLSEAQDTARERRYKNKIVIVAVTGTGTTDVGPSPLFAEFPLSRVHSNALSTILTGQFIRAVEPFPLPIGAAWAFAILFALVASVLSLRNAIIAGAALWLLSFVLPVASFAAFSREIPMAEFLAIFFPSVGLSLMYQAVTKESLADRTSVALKRYLPPELVEKIVSGQEYLDLSTKRKELSVLFVDIEGFSYISETTEVEYLTLFLNEFFETMTCVVFSHHGTVDKFLGDGLLAFFGDPLILDNHALAAVEAAIDMQKQMDKLSARWSQSGVPEFHKGVRMRIGVSTGIVVVGNIGSAQRMEYTVVGSEINVAGRIQSKAPAGGILITSRTHALTRHSITCMGPETVRIKGMDRPVEVYIVDPSPVQESFVSAENNSEPGSPS